MSACEALHPAGHVPHRSWLPDLRRPARSGLVPARPWSSATWSYLSPTALARYGQIAILGWIVMGFGAVCLGLVFARLARMAPATGGPYAYTRMAYGDFAGFLVAWRRHAGRLSYAVNERRLACWQTSAGSSLGKQARPFRPKKAALSTPLEPLP